MKLPLYLGPRARVRMDAGPSLLVYSPGFAPGRYPLQRIGRVNVCKGASMPLRVLGALLANDIPVTILDAGGEALGVCFGLRRRRAEPVAARIEEWLARPDWREHFRDFHAAERRRALIAALKRLHLRAPDLREQTVREFLREQAERRGVPAAHFDFNVRHWCGMAVSLSLTELTGLAGSPLALMRPAIGWHLPREVADVLVWDLREYLLVESARWKKAATVDKREHVGWLVATFEQRTPRLRKLIHGFWFRFLDWLEGEEPWRRPLDT